MRSKAAILLYRVLRWLSWPFRWLWRGLCTAGKAGLITLAPVGRRLRRPATALLAVFAWLFRAIWRPLRPVLTLVGRPFIWSWLLIRQVVTALWRRLGLWGLALRRGLTWVAKALSHRLFAWGTGLARALRWLARMLWRPIRGLGLLLYRPLRWLGARLWRAICWVAPFVWEELGRLGRAAIHLLLVISWPVRAPAGFLWRRFLRPPLARLWQWVSLRALVLGRAIRSRWWIRQARRRMRRRSRVVLAHNRSPQPATRPRGWLRALGVLVALNLLLLVLTLRLASFSWRPAEAGLARPTMGDDLIPTPTRLQLPTATPLPTPIPVTPAPPPDQLVTGGTIAFVARQNGSDGVYALAAGWESPVRLTHHAADDRDPAWSSDGQWLAFSSHRDGNWEIYLLQLADGNLTRLTHNVGFDANPSWSPDGQWLAFESYRDNNLDIYVLPVSGGKPVRLTSNPAADYAPAWAPSGRHIAFVSWRDGNPDVLLFPLDDARDEAAVNITRSPEVAEDHPCWHPGNDYLAYAGQSGSQQLVYAQPMLNNLPTQEPTVIGQGGEPAWSPDGRGLLYVHDENLKHYLLVSSVGAWGATPEVYVSDLPIGAPDWHRATLPTGIRVAGWLSPGGIPLYEEEIADPVSDGPPYTLVQIEDLQVPGPFLNDRVDDSFRALRQRLTEQVGWDLLAMMETMWEPLDAAPPPGLSAQSWNKAGRAFDIEPDLNLGALPSIEVVREPAYCTTAAAPCTGTETWWRVYVRAQRQDGSQGEPLRTQPWSFQSRYSGNVNDYEAGGRVKSAIPPGYYVDLTQLAADYGWESVPAGRTWRTFFPAILFWHFEKREGLTWVEAAQELYTAKELEEVSGALP